ncbi:S-4TM family putative pore-forming effector [uncultured Desulfobacter sp.]|uniref:S-4TM family putative pore-forming effector n=1 Tax=uncultured Desulfobacter sp. TaxID=240139 RepID=UPI002AAA7D6F|nr:S-4TM family putative pore-forming effector [uncultured Desulfobacter sp.]
MVDSFSERQNEPQKLNYLAAQRTLYKKAKSITAIQIFLSVPLIIFVSIAALILNDKDISQLVGLQQVDISWVSAFTGVVVALLDVLILTSLVDNLKEKAAKIQELFDTTVLGLPWNNVAIGSMPDHEDVNKYSRPIRERPDELSKLKDWYSSKLDNLPIETSLIICQRSNLCWDSELRDYFSKLMGAIALFVILFLVAIGLYEGMTLKNLFLIVLAPALPIVIFSTRQWIDNKKAISQLTSLKNFVNDSWDNLLAMQESESRLMERARAVQDQIFINRKTNPLIFDWIYEKQKSRQHESMYYSIDQMIDQYRSSIGT